MPAKQISNKHELSTKTVALKKSLIATVEAKYANKAPGQEFKWSPYLLELIERDLKPTKSARR